MAPKPFVPQFQIEMPLLDRASVQTNALHPGPSLLIFRSEEIPVCREPFLLCVEHRYCSFQIFIGILIGPTLYVLTDNLFEITSKFDCHAPILAKTRLVVSILPRVFCDLRVTFWPLLLIGRITLQSMVLARSLHRCFQNYFLTGSVPSFAILPSGPTTHGRLSAFQFPLSRADHVFPSS